LSLRLAPPRRRDLICTRASGSPGCAGNSLHIILSDVAIGSTYPPHAGCDIALCISAQGWDGPTGLGTANGLAGF